MKMLIEVLCEMKLIYNDHDEGTTTTPFYFKLIIIFIFMVENLLLYFIFLPEATPFKFENFKLKFKTVE